MIFPIRSSHHPWLGGCECLKKHLEASESCEVIQEEIISFLSQLSVYVPDWWQWALHIHWRCCQRGWILFPLGWDFPRSLCDSWASMLLQSWVGIGNQTAMNTFMYQSITYYRIGVRHKEDLVLLLLTEKRQAAPSPFSLILSLLSSCYSKTCILTWVLAWLSLHFLFLPAVLSHPDPAFLHSTMKHLHCLQTLSHSHFPHCWLFLAGLANDPFGLSQMSFKIQLLAPFSSAHSVWAK